MLVIFNEDNNFDSKNVLRSKSATQTNIEVICIIQNKFGNMSFNKRVEQVSKFLTASITRAVQKITLIDGDIIITFP